MVDSKKIISVDRIDFVQKKIGSVKRTDEGFLQGTAAIAKTGILTYGLKDGTTRRELVTEDTLFNSDSMESLKLKPVTNQHPKEVLLDSRTVKKRKIGMTGETVNRDGDFLTTSLIVTDSDAISDIEKGTQELSPGYRVDLSLEEGELNGEKYDAIQIKRKYNHLAACDCARGGHDLRLNIDRVDGFEYDDNFINNNNDLIDKKEKKNMPKLTINNIDYEAAQEVINLVSDLKKDSASFSTKIDGLQAKFDTLSGEHDTLKDDSKKLKDSIPELVLKGVGEKVALDSACKSVLTEDEIKNLDGKSNDEIKKAVILKKYPKATLDGKSEAYLDARFDSVVENIEENSNDSNSIEKQRKQAYQKSLNNDSNLPDGDKAYNDMVKRDSEMWKKDPNEIVKNK